MTDISQEITNAFAATQIIIVFIIFLFTIFYPIIQESIAAEKRSTDAERGKKRLMENKRDTFLSKCLILILGNLLVFFLFLPVIYSIRINWTFNYETYSFMVIFAFMSCFLVWSIYMGYELLNKIRELGNFTRFDTIKYIIWK